MPHNIEIRQVNGVETASFVENARQERAWHGLGQTYDRPLSVIEAIEGCRANFNVGLQPIIGVSPQLENAINGNFVVGDDAFKMIDGKQFVDANMLRDLIIEGRKSTMRLDLNETLGVVSDSYGVVQYKEAFDFIDLMTTGELGGETPTIESAGLLGHGERLFITAKFPEPIRVANNSNDLIDMYIVFTTSHDGTGAVTCMVTPVRVVCNNTLNYAMQHNSGKVSWRHSKHVASRIDLTKKDNARMAYNALGLYSEYKQYFEESLEALAKIRVNDKQAEEIIAKSVLSSDVFKIYSQNNNSMDSEDIPTRSKNIMFNIMDALHSGVGQSELQGGTGLWLVNGLTTYYQNNMSWKDNEKKFNAILEGSVQDKLQSTYNNVLKLAV